MFDALHWPWEYEPIDLRGYIPDFILPFRHGQILVEVKPILCQAEFAPIADHLDTVGWPGEILILGARLFSSDPFHEGQHYISVIGELGQTGFDDDHGRPVRSWDEAPAGRCSECHDLSFCHATQSYACRVNGCYIGSWPIEPASLEWFFSQAKNESQWHP